MTRNIPLNLRQLKRQAKILSQEVRTLAQRPAPPTLSSAQHIIARIWRCSDWHELSTACSPDDLGAYHPQKHTDQGTTISFDEYMTSVVAFGVTHGASHVHVMIRNGLTASRIRVPEGYLMDVPPELTGMSCIRPESIEQFQRYVRDLPEHPLLESIWGHWCGDSCGTSLIAKLNYRNDNISLSRLGLTHHQYAVLRRFALAGPGIIFLAGTCGSGRTTTAKALMNEARHALNDEVVIHELWDSSSVKDALINVRAGKLVIAIMHSGSASLIKASLRFIADGVAHLSDIRSISCYQTLISRVCPACSLDVDRSVQPIADFFDRHYTHPKIDFARMRLRGAGCRCCGRGLLGRTGVFEVIDDARTRFGPEIDLVAAGHVDAVDWISRAGHLVCA